MSYDKCSIGKLESELATLKEQLAEANQFGCDLCLAEAKCNGQYDAKECQRLHRLEAKRLRDVEQRHHDRCSESIDKCEKCRQGQQAELAQAREQVKVLRDYVREHKPCCGCADENTDMVSDYPQQHCLEQCEYFMAWLEALAATAEPIADQGAGEKGARGRPRRDGGA